MAAQQQEIDAKVRSVDGQELHAENLGLDSRYEVVTMEPVSGYGPIVEAWAEMQYPLNVDADGQHGVIVGEGMRHARQFPDGSGVYESVAGGSLYAIRTADEVYVWNSRAPTHDWPYTAREAQDRLDPEEIAVPFGFVGAVVSEQTDAELHHPDSILAMGTEDNVVEGDVFMRGVVTADLHDDGDNRGVLLEHADGIQAFIGYDSTAHGDGVFGFVPFDGKQGVRAPTARDALDLLRPEGVLGNEDRQGEWFLVPADGDDAEGTIQKPGVSERPYGASPLDNHVPRDWKTVVSDSEFVRRVMKAVDDPEETVVEWGDTPEDIIERIQWGRLDMSLQEARELAGGVLVRGSIRHRRNEHTMEVVEDWHQAVTHDQDVLTVDDTTRSVMVD